MSKVNCSRLQNLRLEDSLKLVAKTASAISISIGCLALLGWVFNIEVIKGTFPGSTTAMKANTALCFLLSGVSLGLLLRGGQSINYCSVTRRPL